MFCFDLFLCTYYVYFDLLLVVFFFLMIRRPPISTRTDTLFPYTTLFRSFMDQSLGVGVGAVGGEDDEVELPRRKGCLQRQALCAGDGDFDVRAGFCEAG